MQKTKRFFRFAFVTGLLMSFTALMVNGQYSSKPASPKAIIIENFDSGIVELSSYPNEDEDPLGWELNSDITYENSPWSLKLSGNTWKVQIISPITLNAGDVWQVSAWIASQAEIQGIAVMDAVHVLFYSFAGSQMVNTEEWVPVYQGCFPEGQWNDYQLPVATDWLAFFGYLPEITALVYINDKDGTTHGEVYFDNIINISSDLPFIPEVSIDFTVGGVYTAGNGSKAADVQFYGQVIDPDSEEHDFFWNFGDDSTSTEQNPLHSFIVSDDHPYRVILRVSDPTERWGQASCSVEVDPGSSSFPVTLNFVGDIMLARRYENPGGIIPTLGVEAIFEPTLSILGDVADITVANLECSLTTYWEHHPTKSIYFKGSPENVDGLSYAGIDIVSLANNHTMDYMLPGMLETQSVLEESGILFMGSGANSYEAYLPVFYSKSGVNFAFLAASDRTGQYSNQQPYLNAGYNKPGFANLEPWYIKQQIDEVKDVSDLVVMEWHTGIEYSASPDYICDTCPSFGEDDESDENYFPLAYAPDPKDRATTQYAIDNGADLVICHHPHMIQGVELYNGKLIAHSLGNFAFDQEYPETYPSFILNTKVNESGFYEFTLTPVYIDDYIPQRAEGGLGLHILDDLAQRSKDLDTYLQIDRDSIIARVIMDTVNMFTSSAEYLVDLAMEETAGNWISPPCPLARSGSISSVNSIEPISTYEFRLGRELIFFGNMEDEGCTLWNLNSVNEIYCDTSAFAGERSIQHIRTSGSSTNIITNFEERIVCPSDTLKFSLCGYIKTQNAAEVTIEIRYHTNRTGIEPLGEETIGVQVNGNTPWTFYYRDLTIPEGTKFFDVRVNSGVPESGTAYSWFDNVSLICWEDWAAYEISQSIPTPNDYYFIQVKSPDYSDGMTMNYSEATHEPAHFTEVDLKVFLEGPFNGTDMNTELSLTESFPMSQPYNVNPWNYPGNENVTSIPSNVVDWILVELRDASDATSATPVTAIARQAAFLMNNGNIRTTDGNSKLKFINLSIQQFLYVVINHRNHLAVISANALTEPGGSYSYDFTNGSGQAYNDGQKEIAPGVWGMVAGDADASSSIDGTDKSAIWNVQAGKSGYRSGDLNLNGQTDNSDKNDYWLPNLGQSSKVPE